MRDAEERGVGRAMVAPALLVLAAVAGYPTLHAVWLSLRRNILVFQESRFIGLDNYWFLLHDARFHTALWNTVYFSCCAVSLELALGICIALWLDAGGRGASVLRACILVPWAIPTVVSAKLWAWLLNGEYGLVARMLPLGDIDVLGAPSYAMHAAIVVDAWKTTPFVALLVLAGLKTIPSDIYRACAIDGASKLRVLLHIQLPMLRSTIAVVALLRGLDAFRVFDAIYVLTDGGPAGSTETLSIYAYKTLMRSGDFGYGSTIAVATLLVVALAGSLVLRASGAQEAAR